MLEEFIAAEDLLDRAGLLDTKLPVPLDSVIEYLAKDGLELHYYDPKLAPESVKNAAYGVDEVLHWKDGTATLFVNQNRPRVRQRFSLCHGIGHFLLPSHRNLNYLARGCNAMRPLTTKPYERQADRFAACPEHAADPFPARHEGSDAGHGGDPGIGFVIFGFRRKRRYPLR